jgi:hypothetical protein
MIRFAPVSANASTSDRPTASAPVDKGRSNTLVGHRNYRTCRVLPPPNGCQKVRQSFWRNVARNHDCIDPAACELEIDNRWRAHLRDGSPDDRDDAGGSGRYNHR